MKAMMMNKDGSSTREDEAGEADALFACPCDNCRMFAIDVARNVMRNGILNVSLGVRSTPSAFRAGVLRAAITMTVASPQHAGRTRDQLRMTWMRLAVEAFDQIMDAEAMETLEQEHARAGGAVPPDGKVH